MALDSDNLWMSASFSSPRSSSIDGATYYSDCKDQASISNPIIDNDVRMKFSGFWEKNWSPETRNIDTIGYGLKKTKNGSSAIFCNDASKLVSMSDGYVGMVLSFPQEIVDGVYAPLLNDTSEVNEYLLWGVNIGAKEPSQPTIYAALTPRGIEFTIWTGNAKDTIIDTSTTVSANTDIFIEFVWGANVIDYYLIRAAIRVNNENVALSNLPMSQDDIIDLNFYVLNTESSSNNLECTIRKLITYNTLPLWIREDFANNSLSNLQNFEPSRGLAAISEEGLQKYPENLDSYSKIFSQLSVSANNTKYSIDSAWESGDIYHCDYDSGVVKKISYDGTEIATLQLTHPVIVSAIQYSTQMQRSITVPPQQDQGCWIADVGDNKIIKTDNQLNVLYEINGIGGITNLVADIDGGCYFSDSSTETFVKVSSIGNILGVIPYSNFNPAITEIDQIVPYQGSNLESWVLSDGKIYGMRYSDGMILQWIGTPRDPITDLGSAWTGGSAVGSIDLDRNTNNLYVTGGDKFAGWVAKYESGEFTGYSIDHDIAFPYLLKIAQGYGSNAFYVLSYTNLDSSSSSSSSISSSSSSDGHSMSSTSSSETSSSETSVSETSSSESSFGYATYFKIQGGGQNANILLTNPIQITIDWGDGNIEEIYESGIADHNYPSSEEYIIAIKGSFNNGKIGIAGGISEILTPFQNLTGITDFSDTFNSNSQIETLPDGLFDNYPDATSFDHCFAHCTALTTIPSGLFANCSQTTTFYRCFLRCHSLTEIPLGLFDDTINATNFENCFGDCLSLTAIPLELFRYCTSAYNCIGVFSSCTALTSISATLFMYCPDVYSFSAVFSGCTSLQSIPAGIFRLNANVLSFTATFRDCTSATGNAPQLWIEHPGASGTLCFQNDTGLTNYSSIPINWK